VTAKAAGTAVITVVTEDGDYEATCTVTVKQESPASGSSGSEGHIFTWNADNESRLPGTACKDPGNLMQSSIPALTM